MLRHLHVTLLVGPVVAVLVPKVVLQLLRKIEVKQSSGMQSDSGFELTFALPANSPLDTIFLLAGGTTPLLRVIIVATVNAVPQVLMDGVVTQHRIDPGAPGGTSMLHVTGKDLTRVMALQDFGGLPYPAMPVEARVALIVAKYAVFGLVPLVVPTLFPEAPIPIERVPTHDGSDLEYVEGLARDAGYVFYVEPGPLPGANVAYFGPQIKFGVPQPALDLEMDHRRNVDSLTFRFETAEASLPIVLIQNQLTRVPIPLPIPNLNPLQPPLGLIPAAITNVEVLRDTARLSPMAALSRGVAAAARSQDAVRGSGSLDASRYGRLLRARQLVGVRGAGTAFDGLHYVASVTTTIEAGQCKQSFELSRNGIVSITPTVPT